MSQSPIVQRPLRKLRAKPLDGVNLTDVIKARKEQDRVLHARLKQIDSEIKTLMTEHEKISMVLGIDPNSPADDPPSSPTGNAFGLSEEELRDVGGYKCADCGSAAGPNARGDCASCGAGPFEQAR